MLKISAISLLILIFSSDVCSQNLYRYKQPADLNDGWKTADLYSLDIDTTRMFKFFTQVQNNKTKLHSMLLVMNNELLVEEYLNKESADKPHDLRSVTKSIRALLLGIAIDKGFIESVDDPISNYLGDLKPNKNLDARKDSITIRHLITMSTGLECNDWDKKSAGQEDRVYKKKNWLQYTLDLPMINDPGSVSYYCSMGSIMTAEIISRASGMTLDDFAKAYLFAPLGITNYKWGHTSKKKVIDSGKRLYMTSRDLAKLGQLVLQKGMWNGEQLISDSWIEKATSAQTKINGTDYGFLWWNIPIAVDDRIFETKMATGNGGQYIMIVEELNVMAVFTGGAYNSEEDKIPFAILNSVFLPTILSME